MTQCKGAVLIAISTLIVYFPCCKSKYPGSVYTRSHVQSGLAGGEGAHMVRYQQVLLKHKAARSSHFTEIPHSTAPRTASITS